MYWDIKEEGGLIFENMPRNKTLEKKGVTSLKKTKIGTTFVGVVFDQGVVLEADTIATEGHMVADPDCLKIHYLSPNIYC